MSVRFDRPRCTEGDEVGATATVTNHLPWPAVGLAVRDTAGRGARLPAVGGRAVTACRWVFVPPHRGQYPVRPRIETAFPFGLWPAGRTATVFDRLIVWPKTYPVDPVPTAAHDETSDGPNVRGKVCGTGDLFAVRPYRRGDSPRRIHWRQSTEHDRLVVCELQAAARPVVLNVLDTDPAVHTPGPDGTFEWAVRVAASLAAGWLEAGAQVGLAWAGHCLPPRAGREQATRLLDVFAVVGPAAGGWDTPALRAGVRVVVNRPGPVRSRRAAEPRPVEHHPAVAAGGRGPGVGRYDHPHPPGRQHQSPHAAPTRAAAASHPAARLAVTRTAHSRLPPGPGVWTAGSVSSTFSTTGRAAAWRSHTTSRSCSVDCARWMRRGSRPGREAAPRSAPRWRPPCPG